MHRDEQVARISLKDGKVLLISNLYITERFLHPDYFCKPGPGAVSDMGLLSLFELLHKSEGIPSFTARWDVSRADRRPSELELDIAGVPISVMRKFRTNRDGYHSHHIDKSPDTNRRVYEVRIETPSGLVFDADISFVGTPEAEPRVHPDLEATVDSAVQRAEILTRQPGGEKKSPRISAKPNIYAVAWLNDKIRSCISYLSNRSR